MKNKWLEKLVITDSLVLKTNMIISIIALIFYFFHKGVLYESFLNENAILFSIMNFLLFLLAVILVVTFLFALYVNIIYLKQVIQVKELSVYYNCLLPFALTFLTAIIITFIGSLIPGNHFLAKKEYYGADYVLTEGKYLVKDNYRTCTDSSDGYINGYFEINLNNKKVAYLQDEVSREKRIKEVGRIEYVKTLNDNELEELKQLLDDVFSEKNNGSLNKESGLVTDLYAFSSSDGKYTFNSINKKNVVVYNRDIIEKFKNLVEE